MPSNQVPALSVNVAVGKTPMKSGDNKSPLEENLVKITEEQSLNSSQHALKSTHTASGQSPGDKATGKMPVLTFDDLNN